VTKKPSLLELGRNGLILFVLLALVWIPRPAAGYLDLASAHRYEAGKKALEAGAEYASAAGRLPWEPDLFEQAGNAYLNGKDYIAAADYYGRAALRHALSTAGYQNWGDAELMLDHPSLAVDIWSSALGRGGDSTSLLPRIARADEELSHFGLAIQAWQKYLAGRPGDPFALYRLGLLLMTTSPGDALSDLMQSARLDPSLDTIVQGLRTALNTALLSNDGAYQLLVSGRALAALGKWALAEQAFDNATVLNPDYADAWAWLGEAKQQQGLDGKIEIEHAMKLNSNSAMVQSLYGVYLQRHGQPKMAVLAYQQAASLEPENAGWELALGGAYEQIGDLVAALAHYQQAVRLAPDDPVAWRALASFSLRNSVDLIGIGLPATLRLMELSNNDWQSFDIAGQILLETGDPVGAEDMLKRAIDLDPTQPAPPLHLALLYLQGSDRSKAFSYLTQAKTFDPNGPYGWQANRLLEQYFP
jgi:tetratricopeptide (TPR) repeat protein